MMTDDEPKTFQVGPWEWMIDGERVALSRSTPDTEEQARAVLEEARNSSDD